MNSLEIARFNIASEDFTPALRLANYENAFAESSRNRSPTNKISKYKYYIAVIICSILKHDMP